MDNKQNLHTHTTYADGKDTPEEIVLAAIDKGFASLGFSEHSYLTYSSAPNQLTPDKIQQYKAEIRNLKDKYRGKIDVFCGLEYDFYSDIDVDDFDYLIGSVHYLDVDGKIVTFDRGYTQTLNYINDYFSGDGLAFAKKYFNTVSCLPEKQNFDIIGHFDLITKNNDVGAFFDTSDPKYLNMGFESIHNLKGKIPFFEVNTGAIARGYKSTPYPQMDFLKEFRRLGFGAVITSDCHDKRYIDCFHSEATTLLKEAGFQSKWILTDNGFCEVEL